MKWTVEQILNELTELDEHQRIEAKRGSGIGHSVMQTICAFANEPGLGGGWLLLGVDEPDTTHDTFWVSGVENTDKLLNELQNNCRNQFEHPIYIECKHAKIDGKSVIGVFVYELEPSAKPCRFVGKQDKHNKRKTGVWRRGANGDYECSEQELEPILMAKAGLSYEQVILPDVSLDDLDEKALDSYRKLRAKVRANAPELQLDNLELLKALRLVKKQGDEYRPNIAGLLLFGKELSLRTHLPAVRVDYVLTSGNRWVEDPENRFQYSVDLQEPLIQLIPKMEQIIMNDLPRYFRLEEGAIQRSDYPALPHKVVREALVNALMHRDYGIHQPTLIVRYRNRLEFNNAGYSLKPLDEPDGEGSVLRNPILARVLYDLEFAETKGTGFQLMQRLLLESGLTKPILVSSRTGRRFKASFLLHQLMSEEHLTWLQQWRHLNLSDDEAKALIFVLEMEAIDNAALRTITDLGTLEASQLLGKLWQKYHLLEKAGSGRNTYYRATPLLLQGSNREINKQDLAANTQELPRNTRELASNAQELVSDTQELPQSLREAIKQLTPKTRKPKLQHIILQLCELRAWTAEALATLLNRKVEALRTSHLTPLRQKALIAYVYPEVVNHPNQAYVITEKGKEWLKSGGKP
ncbi:RNA-binding domain-containing protein [Legionella pneumophila]|uniref:RNA-binding domain-containing protein n=1 Tax=Legionella pneumophila TaxID=446 RepID=UPI000770B341|nr:RNA-binding domain-containing protein [Legionella pneumophila]CZP19598.1 Divergent AAA domain [Legionella pneumophila]CZP47334.1 Divergent AAA domain [Legionella pneumophila]